MSPNPKSVPASRTPPVVLYVEDDDFEAELMQQALKESGGGVLLFRVANAKAALEYLLKEGQYHAARGPAVIVLDINMPGISGLELLATIRESPDIQVPVVMLTSSMLSADRDKAEELGAEKFITKSMDWEGCLKTAHSIKALVCSNGG